MTIILVKGVLKLDKSNNSNLVHPSNILAIVSTNDVSKLDKFNDTNEEQ